MVGTQYQGLVGGGGVTRDKTVNDSGRSLRPYVKWIDLTPLVHPFMFTVNCRSLELWEGEPRRVGPETLWSRRVVTSDPVVSPVWTLGSSDLDSD